MTIKDEYNLSKNYYIETEEFEGKLLAKLTLNNVAIVEAVIKSVISIYANRYKVNLHSINLNDYISYRKTIDNIIKNSNSKISRNGFDHLLWYFHKGKKS